MKKFLLLIILFSNFIFSQNEENKKFVGFEIFLLEKYERNPNSYAYLSKTKMRRFQKKYGKTYLKIPDSTCHDYLNWNKNRLDIKPFLSKSDIEFYDWDNYTIRLTETGIEKVKSLKGSVPGIPFAIVVKGKIQFGGKFSFMFSSQVNDRVYTRIEVDIKELKLNFIGCGKDPRNTIEFKNNLIVLTN